MAFVIEKDIPHPAPRTSLNDTPYRTIVLQMEKGDSFVAVKFDDKRTDKDMMKEADRIRTGLSAYAKRHDLPYKFSFRRMPDGSYRIWRTE